MRARYVLLRVNVAGTPLKELIRPPWRRYVVESRLARELVVRALTANVGPRLFHFSAGGALFEGSVSADGFRIRRVIHYRNSFLPLIIGRFERSPYGTRIEITMRPVIAVIGLWIFWMGAVSCVGILAGRAALRHQPRALAAEPVVVAMLAFGYLLASGLFGFEAYKAKPMIEEILTTATTGAGPSP